LQHRDISRIRASPVLGFQANSLAVLGARI
jgi:hypothetical protein